MDMHISPLTHSNIHPIVQPFDLRVNAYIGPAMDYISTDLGVDISSHIPFRV